MPEQDLRSTSVEKPELGSRSRLLMPVVKGNTLENGDVSGFLAGRLSVEYEEDEPCSASNWS